MELQSQEASLSTLELYRHDLTRVPKEKTAPRRGVRMPYLVLGFLLGPAER